MTIFSVAVFGLAIVSVWLLVSQLRQEAANEAIWELVDSGQYQSVEYGYDTYSRRSGAMVHSTRTVRYDVTVLRFADGRTVLMKQKLSVPFKFGEMIFVYRNRNGKYQLRAESQKGHQV